MSPEERLLYARIARLESQLIDKTSSLERANTIIQALEERVKLLEAKVKITKQKYQHID